MNSNTPNRGTFEYWQRVVAGSVQCTPEQRDAIARHAFESERNGITASAWHSAHVVLNTPVCHCQPCSKKARICLDAENAWPGAEHPGPYES